MLEMLVARLRDKNSAHREVLLLFSIVALILQRSVSEQGLLTEAAKAVLLNTQLGSAVEGIIEKACERGPRVAQIDEQAGGGEILLSALVFHLFWLRSFPAVWQESIDWHDFLFMDCYDVQNNQPMAPDLHTSDRYGSLPINIQCHQLCRLLYFGTPSIKLVVSYSLVEMLSHIADWKETDENHSVKRELKCSPVYLQSVVMVLQGFILQVDNICTAKNAAACVYWLLVCKHLNSKQQKAIEGSKWYRLILEELVLCLATPNSVYYSFKSGENPSAYIGIALLRMCPPPEWVRSVLSGACIRSIVENLSSYKPTPEIVVLFRELLRGGYIQQEQIAKLQHLFQTVRRCVYMDKPRGDRIPNNHYKQMTHSAVDCNEITTRMVELAMCVRVDPITGARTHTSEDEEEANRDLIAEIDEFLRESATYA